MGLLPKLGLDWTTNSILCTPNEPSFTGMSEKVWKRVNSLKPEKIWPLWRRIMKKLVLTASKAKAKKKTNTKSQSESKNFFIKHFLFLISSFFFLDNDDDSF